ncbi:hypothetical protein HKD37_10G027622 [Glycine soja]
MRKLSSNLLVGEIPSGLGQKSLIHLKWALAADKDGVDDTVYEKYNISKEKWAKFCQTHRDPSWEDVRKKEQAIQKQNTTLHVLSRGGYEYLEQKLMAKKTKKRLKEAAQFGSIEGIIDPPFSIRRHVKWKMARTKRTEQMTSEAAKEIAEKIDLEEQASQGSFIAHGHQDVLTAAIGRPEHPGRVCAAGADVTIKQYFGSTSRTARSSSFMPLEDLQQLTQQIRDQLEESITKKVTWQVMASFSHMQSQFQSKMQSQGLALPLEPEVPMSIQKRVVLIPQGTIQRRETQTNAGLRVGVEEVKDAEASVPVPTDEVMWDATVFGVFNQNFSLYIKHEDLSEIAHGGQCLSISSSKRDVYLGAYLNGRHLQMVIIPPKENLVVWFCSLHNMPDYYLKGIINSALKGLDDTPQPKSKATAWWIVVKYFNDVRPFEAKRFKALRIQWAQYYLKVRNQT